MNGKPLSEHTRQKIIDSGDTSLWDPVIQWYRYRLVRFIEGLGADHHLAEDLAQNTFIKAVQKFDQFTSDCGSFAPWLFAIARNEFLSAHRTERSKEKGTGTTTWMQRQTELTDDGVRLADLEPTLEDREQAVLSAIAHPRFPYAEELVEREFNRQLEYLLEHADEPLVDRVAFQLIARLDQAASQQFRNAMAVCESTPRRNWEIFLLRQMLRTPAKLAAKLLRIPYSASIHKIGYRVRERLEEPAK